MQSWDSSWSEPIRINYSKHSLGELQRPKEFFSALFYFLFILRTFPVSKLCTRHFLVYEYIGSIKFGPSLPRTFFTLSITLSSFFSLLFADNLHLSKQPRTKVFLHHNILSFFSFLFSIRCYTVLNKKKKKNTNPREWKKKVLSPCFVIHFFLIGWKIY